MNKNSILKALDAVESQSKQRKFVQSIELMINLQGLDLNKPESRVDLKIKLPHAVGEVQGKSLLFGRTEAYVNKVKHLFQRVIMDDQVGKLKKEDLQQILTHDVILAEGPAMLTVAKYWGQDLAPKGKMPKLAKENPDDLKLFISSLLSSIQITNKRGKTIPVIQVVIGKESMPKEQLAENALVVLDRVVEVLPIKLANVHSLYVKKSMGPAIKISL